MYISNTCPTSNTIQHSDHLRTMTACVYSRFISPPHTAIASLTMSTRTSKTSSSSTSTVNSGAGLYSFTYILYTIGIATTGHHRGAQGHNWDGLKLKPHNAVLQDPE